jgi:lycopene cyclase domain-containing protein
VTYGTFLAVFLGVPLVALIFLTHRQLSRGLLLTLLLISAVAVLYTGPWDNLIVNNGVWSYAPSKITGIVIGRVPLEEYLFYVLQVFLTGLLTARVLLRLGNKTTC